MPLTMRSLNRFAILASAALALVACSQPKWASHEAGGAQDSQATTQPATQANAPNDADGTSVPTSSDPLPPYPAWATPLLGKPLTKAFPKSFECIGNIDQVLMKYKGTPSGTVVFGWGYDLGANEPIDRIVLSVDGKISGAGTGGYERDDVPVQNTRVSSKKTGWRAATTLSAGGVDAWGVARAGASICPLGHLYF